MRNARRHRGSAFGAIRALLTVLRHSRRGIHSHHKGHPMLVDHRTYTVRPGTMAKQMALYQEFGWKPQTRHLGQPLAYLITEFR